MPWAFPAGQAIHLYAHKALGAGRYPFLSLTQNPESDEAVRPHRCPHSFSDKGGQASFDSYFLALFFILKKFLYICNESVLFKEALKTVRYRPTPVGGRTPQQAHTILSALSEMYRDTKADGRKHNQPHKHTR